MISLNNERVFRVGDSVTLKGFENEEGSIESIRVISNASMVEEFKGYPSDVVVTIRMNDAIVNKRGAEIL